MPDSFYSSKEWRALRAKVRAIWRRETRGCAWCHKPFRPGEKMIVDHILNRRQHPELALDPANLQCLHSACNTRKAAWHENSRSAPTRNDGFPQDGSWDK